MTKTEAVGIVSGNPIITTNSDGTIVGNLFVTIKDVGRAKVFFDDPHSLHMFSFQDEDEIKVEWWKKGQWLNANVLSPKGTANAEKQLERALSERKPEGMIEKYVDAIVLIRRKLIDGGLDSTIDEDVTLDAVEETYRSASMGIFIELNKKGINLDELLG